MHSNSLPALSDCEPVNIILFKNQLKHANSFLLNDSCKKASSVGNKRMGQVLKNYHVNFCHLFDTVRIK